MQGQRGVVLLFAHSRSPAVVYEGCAARSPPGHPAGSGRVCSRHGRFVWRHHRRDLHLPLLGSGLGKHVIPTIESRNTPATVTSRRWEALPRWSSRRGRLVGSSCGIDRILLSLPGSSSHLLPPREEPLGRPGRVSWLLQCLTRRSDLQTVTCTRWKGPWTRLREASRMPLDRVRPAWPGSRRTTPAIQSASIRPTWQR